MALITKGKSHAKGEYASMDLTSVVGTLESHWVVLDAELAEIKKDIAAKKKLLEKGREQQKSNKRDADLLKSNYFCFKF